jgi:hypothetical protein
MLLLEGFESVVFESPRGRVRIVAYVLCYFDTSPY